MLISLFWYPSQPIGIRVSVNLGELFGNHRMLCTDTQTPLQQTSVVLGLGKLSKWLYVAVLLHLMGSLQQHSWLNFQTSFSMWCPALTLTKDRPMTVTALLPVSSYESLHCSANPYHTYQIEHHQNWLPDQPPLLSTSKVTFTKTINNSSHTFTQKFPVLLLESDVSPPPSGVKTPTLLTTYPHC